MSESKSSDQWRELYDTSQGSGFSKSVFCRKYDINYHPFLYGYNKFSKGKNKLIPVKRSPSTESLASIRLSSGQLLEISSLAALKLILNNAL